MKTATPVIKEETLVRRQVQHVEKSAEALAIRTTEDLPQAADLLSKIKTAQKILKERKEEITKPLNASLAAVRNLFRPLETACEKAEAVVKQKMVEVHRQAQIAADAAREKVMKQAPRLKAETISRKLEAIEEAPEAIRADTGGQSRFKSISEVVIVDETKVPRKYLSLNMVLIRRDALAGVEIPGVSVEEKTVVAAS